MIQRTFPALIGADQVTRLTELLNSKFCVTIFLVLFAAYIGELGSPTFSNDYFVDIMQMNSRFYAYVLDGRYLSEAIRHVFGGIYPPSLMLILGLLCLVICGLMVCLLLGITNWGVAALVCSLFSTSPMLFEIFSYPSIRFFVPLAALFSVLSIVTPSSILGVLFVIIALNFYQSAIHLALVVTIYAAAVRLQTESFSYVFRRFVVPRAIRVVVGMILYGVILTIVSGYFRLGSGATRLASFAKIASSLENFKETSLLLLRATFELYTKDVFFFPSFAKYLFVAIAVALIVGMAVRRNAVGTVLVVLAPLSVFGAAWAMFPVNHMLNERILFGFAGVYAATIAAAWLTLPKLRPVVFAVGWTIVATFVFQANVWHQFMDLRNRADIDLARSISDRVKALPGYRRKMPLVIVGKIQDENYLTFRTFDTKQGIVGNSMLSSMYSAEWSADRALVFFLDFTWADPAKRKVATADAATMPAWPAEGSVALKQDVIVVRLN